MSDDLKSRLDPMAYHVTQEEGTERAFTGTYWDCKDEGVYRCVVCDEELFSSDTKYDSGSGWPSFYQPVDGLESEKIGTKVDRKLFSSRTEVHCEKCGAHLGHVFDDGPNPTGLRYCINSAALNLSTDEAESSEGS